MSPDRSAADESLRERGLPMFVPIRRWHDGLIVRSAAPMIFVMTLVLGTAQALRLFDVLNLAVLGQGTTAAQVARNTPDRSAGLIVLRIALALAAVVWLVLLIRSGRCPRARAFVPRGVRWRRLVGAVGCYVAVVTWAAIALGGSHRDGQATRVVTLLLVAFAVGVPVGVVVVFRYLTSRIPEGGYRTTFAVLAMLAAYVSLAAELRQNDALTGGHFFLVSTLVVAAVLVGVWSGLFAILGWSGRAALREARTVTSIAGRIVPVFMLIVVFGLFAADPWQVTLKLRGSRLVETIGLILAIALFTSWGTARAELTHSRRDAERGGHSLGRLTRAQAVNTYVKISATQLIQGLLFLVMVSAVLLVLVTVAIPDETVRTWIGEAPTPLRLLGIDTGFTRNALDTSVFMAAFAMLSFLVAAATDPEYRTELFDPMVDEIRETIVEVNHDAPQPSI